MLLRFLNKKTKWPLHTLSVHVVLSQTKLPNLGSRGVCRRPFCRVLEQKDEVTSIYPWCPQCPGGHSSAQTTKSWLFSFKGVCKHPYFRGLEQKDQVTTARTESSQSPGHPESTQNVKWNCWAPVESVYTHIAGVLSKKDLVTWDLHILSASLVSSWSWVSSKC